MNDIPPEPTGSGESEIIPWSPRDFAPVTWFTQPENSTIFIAIYKVLGVTQETLPEAHRILDLPQVRGIFSYGTFNYLDFGKVENRMTDEGRLHITPDHIRPRQAPPGCYLYLMTPLSLDGTSSDEAAARQRIQSAVGLLATILGRNVVYKRITENEMRISDGTLTSWGPVIDNPHWFAIPDITLPRLSFIAQLASNLAELDISEQNRINLSLRWLEAALYETGVDALLKYWIAIEALALPSTDVRPMNERLAQIYQLNTFQEANRRFLTGRIQGLRSRIVHDGLIVPVHAALLRYLEALYCDLLLAIAGLPPEHRAIAALRTDNFDLDSYLTQIQSVH